MSRKRPLNESSFSNSLTNIDATLAPPSEELPEVSTPVRNKPQASSLFKAVLQNLSSSRTPTEPLTPGGYDIEKLIQDVSSPVHLLSPTSATKTKQQPEQPEWHQVDVQDLHILDNNDRTLYQSVQCQSSTWKRIARQGPEDPWAFPYYQLETTQLTQWRNALRSSFFQWMHGTTMPYFYILAEHTVVLFRQDEILLSSSNKELRDCLRNKGARLCLSASWQDFEGEFQEEWMQRKKMTIAPTSPGTLEDLEALRRATIVQSTNFSVQFPTQHGKIQSFRTMPPLRIEGKHDCYVLLEVLLNRPFLYGPLSEQLPTIVAPQQFVHASIEQTRFNGKECKGIIHCISKVIQTAIEHTEDHLVLTFNPVTFTTKPYKDSTTIGVSTVTRFNTSEPPLDYGNHVKMVVWDSSRPSTVLYKVHAPVFD